MDLNKTILEIKTTLGKTADLKKAFVDLHEAGKQTHSYSCDYKITEIMNALCKKSKRVLFENKLKPELSSYSKNPIVVGINIAGLGSVKNWSSQLSIFGGERRYNVEEDVRQIKEILITKPVFDELLKNVNKRSVSSLRKMRNYLLQDKKVSGDFKDIEIRNGEEKLTIVLDNRGEINDICLFNNGNKIDIGYLRKLRGVLNGNWEEVFTENGTEALKDICSLGSELSLDEIKIFLFIASQKKVIKEQIKERIKSYNKFSKALAKKDKFLDSMLNPLKAVDNL